MKRRKVQFLIVLLLIFSHLSNAQPTIEGANIICKGDNGIVYSVKGFDIIDYGYIYNYWVAQNENFAPNYWRVPTNGDFAILARVYSTSESFQGNYNWFINAGGPLKSTGTTYWNSPNTGATNSSQFCAVGNGARSSVNGSFYGKGDYAYLVTTGYKYDHTNWSLGRYESNDVLNYYDDYATDNDGAAVRLIYDGEGSPTSVTDYDGNIYDVVKIGTQYWTKQNWKCKHLNDGTPIPELKGNSDWCNANRIARCVYDNNEGNIKTFAWSYSGDAISMTPSGSTVSIDFPSGFNSGTLTVSQYAGNNLISKANLTIGGESKPTTPGAISGIAAKCPGLTGQTYSVAAVTGATTYTWQKPNGWTITAGQNTRTITVTTGSANQNGTISVTAGNSCGTSAASTKAVTIISNPVTLTDITVTAGTEPTCQLTNGTTTTTYSSTPANNVGGLTYSVFPTNAGSLYYGTGMPLTWTNGYSGTSTITVTANGCGGTTATKTRTVNVTPSVGTPSIPSVSTTTICQGSGNTVFTTSATNATSYTWTVTGTGNTISGTGTTGTVTWNPSFLGNATVSVRANGCNGPSASAGRTVVIVQKPAPFYVGTSATSYCQGASGVNITLSSSQTGVNYLLMKNGAADGSPISGNGGELRWINKKNGTYSVLATNATTGCNQYMTGNWVITENPLPTTFNVGSSATSYCQGASGVNITLSGSQTGVNYQLMKNGVADGTTISGTGSALNWPNKTSGTYTVLATNATTTCSQPMTGSKVIVLNPLPVIYAMGSSATAYCQGATGVSITLSGSQTGVNYQLMKNGAVDGTTVSGTGSALNWPNKTSGTYTVLATNATTTCSQTMSDSKVVTVIPKPDTPSTITGTALTCAGVTGLTYSISAVSGADGYNWYVPSGWSITSGQGTVSVVLSTSESAVSGNVVVIAYNCSGASAASTKLVTVPPRPGTPSPITGTTTQCLNTEERYSISGGVQYAESYIWIITAPGWRFIINPEDILSSGSNHIETKNTYISLYAEETAVSGNVMVLAKSNCGTSAASTKAVTVTPIPGTPSTISGTTPVCAGATGLTYSIAAVSGATSYTWSVPSGWSITSGQGTTSVELAATSSAGGGNITVTANNCSGTSTASTKAVTVTPKPGSPLTISGTTPVCAGATGLAYSIAAVSGATGYTWSVPSGWSITSGQGTTAVVLETTSSAASGNITVTANNCSGTSIASTKAVTVTPKPGTPLTITGTTPVCPNTTGLTYSIAAVSGATGYTWSTPSGWSITSGQGTTSVVLVTTSSAASGNITVTASNCSGASAASTKAVTVNPIPGTPSTITGPGPIPVCPNETDLTYSIAAVSGATGYSWSVPSGWNITSGQGTVSVVVSTSSSAVNGEIKVTANNCSGASSAAVKYVQIWPKPGSTSPITGATTQCLNTEERYSITGGVQYATSYIWIMGAPPGWSFHISPEDILSSGANWVETKNTYIDLYAEETAISGNVMVLAKNCSGTSETVTKAVTVIPLPSLIVTQNAPSCNSSVQLTATGADAYTWTPATGLSCTDCANPIATQNGTYTVTGSRVGGCSSQQSITVTAITNLPGLYTVYNSNDSGTGSLRAAIEASNANTENLPHQIVFCESGSPYSIVLQSELPNIIQSATIDGSNLSDYPEILNYGIKIRADNCKLNKLFFAGLVFSTGCIGQIDMYNCDNIIIENSIVSGATRALFATDCHGIYLYGSKFGTNKSGTADYSSNMSMGLWFENCTNLIIGNRNNGNIVSGTGRWYPPNSSTYLTGGLTFKDCYHAIISGNLIGTDITGNISIPNIGDGIRIQSCEDFQIGGSNIGEENIIANNASGIIIYGYNSAINNSDIRIVGNKIGIGKDGTALGNGINGIYVYGGLTNSIIGGLDTKEGNIIANNGNTGIVFERAGNNNINKCSILKNSIFNNPKSFYFSYNATFQLCPNDGKQAPTITWGNSTAGIISGTSAWGNTAHFGDHIELFRSDANGINAYEFIGEATVGNDGIWTATGVNLNSGQVNYVIATITDAIGFNSPNLENTSRFSSLGTIPITCPNITVIAPTTSCLGSPVTFSFIQTETLSGETYSWNFGDGFTSTLKNPTHTYTATGSYNVALTITQPGCDAVTFFQNFVVSNISAPTLTLTQPDCSVSTGTIQVSAPLGAEYEYSKDGTNYQTISTFSGLVAGSYNITVRNTTTACTSEIITASINEAPTLPPVLGDITGENTVCGGSAGEVYSIDGGHESITNGYLYNWYAAIDENMFPADCALPTQTDFQILSTFLGGDAVSGGKLKEAGINHWNSPNTDADNSSEFTALGGGYRDRYGTFDFIKNYSWFWTSIISYQGYDQHVAGFLDKDNADFFISDVAINFNEEGLSIRAIYTGSASTVTDIDGNVYDVITIGTQKWLKQNWACTKYNDGTPIPKVTDGTEWENLTTPAYCAYNNDESLVKSTASVATYTWSYTGGTGVTINGTGASVTLNFAEGATSGTLTVSTTNSCGTSITSKSIVVNNLAAPTLTLTQPDCSVSTGTIQVSAPLGAEYEYSKDGTNYQTSSTFSGLVAGSYNITARNITTACTSEITSSTINEAPTLPPVLGDITGVNEVCQGNTGEIYSINQNTRSLNGYLYNRPAYTHPSFVPNSNWAVGDETSFSTLLNFLGALDPYTGPYNHDLSNQLRESGGAWNWNSGGESNSSGMTLLPSGYRIGSYFGGYRSECRLASTTTQEGAPHNVFGLNIWPDLGAFLYYYGGEERLGEAVRLHWIGQGIPPQSITDIDGNIYDVIPIGTQYWLKQNWACTKFNDGTPIPNVTDGTEWTNLTTPAYCAYNNDETLVKTQVPATYTWSYTGGTGVTINGTGASVTLNFAEGATSGTLNVSTTNSCGISESSLPITVNPQPPTPAATLIHPLCGQVYGTIQVDSPIEGTTYEYSTDGVNYQDSPTFIDKMPGSYNVTARNKSTLCTSVPLGVIIEPAPLTIPIPTIELIGSNPGCEGETVTLRASLADSYAWSNGATTQEIAVNATETFTVAVTKGTCTSANSEATIVTLSAIPAAPTLTLTQPVCGAMAGSIEITSPLGADLEYSINGTDYQSETLFADLAPKAYYVTARNTVGNCPSAATLAIIINPVGAPNQPTISVNNNASSTFCAGGSITLTSNAAQGNLWSNGETTRSIIVDAAGTYTVQVIDASCSSAVSDPLAVTVLDRPETPVATLTQPTCEVQSGELTITSPTGAGIIYSITGYPFKTDPTFSELPLRNYNVIAKNSLTGCQSIALAVLFDPIPLVPAKPVITANPALLFCEGGSTVLSSSSTMGNVWSNGETTREITANSAATYTVQVTSGTCVSPVSDPVSTQTFPSFTLTDITYNNTCAGSPVTFKYEADQDLTGAEFVWEFGNGNAGSTLESPNYTYTQAGTYTVTLTVVVAGCPEQVLQKSITLIEGPVILGINQSQVCHGDSREYIINATTPFPEGETTYAWDFGDGTTSTLSNPIHAYELPGTYKLKLIVTTLQCGKLTYNKDIIVNYSVSFTGLNAEYFVGDEASVIHQKPIGVFGEFNDKDNIQYDEGQNLYVFTPLEAGTFNIVYEYNDGTCSSFFAQNVTVREKVRAYIEGNTSLCDGETSTDLKVVYTGEGEWSFNLGKNQASYFSAAHITGNEYVVTNCGEGTYNLITVLDKDGIGVTTDYNPFKVSPQVSPMAVFGGTGSGCLGDESPIYIDFTKGAAPYIFSYIYNGTTFNSSTSDNRYQIPNATEGSYQLKKVENMFCTTPLSEVREVSFADLPPVSINGLANSYCKGDDEVTFTGSPGGGTYSGPGFVTQPDGTCRFNPFKAGSFTLTYSYTDPVSGCRVQAVKTVIVHERPTAEITGSAYLCGNEGTSLQVTLKGAQEYTLEYQKAGVSGSGTVEDPSPRDLSYIWEMPVSANAVGDYQLVSVTANGCLGAILGSGTTIEQHPIPTATVIDAGEPEVCAGVTLPMEIEFTGTQPFTYMLLSPTGPSHQSIDAVLASYNLSLSGTYKLASFKDAYCDGTVSGEIKLTVKEVPKAKLMGSGGICKGQEAEMTIEFSGPTPYSYEYKIDDDIMEGLVPDQENVVVLKEALPKTYQMLRVWNELGCEGLAEGTVAVMPKELPVVSMSVSDGGRINANQEAEIVFDFEKGEADWVVTYSINGNVQEEIVASESPYVLTTNVAGVYRIVSINDPYCEGEQNTDKVLVSINGEPLPCKECISSFAPIPGEKYILSAWVKQSVLSTNGAYSDAGIEIAYEGVNETSGVLMPKGGIIDGWQKIDEEFVIPFGTTAINVKLVNGSLSPAFFDDIRIQPFKSSMKTYVYDPITLKLSAELDENNYATFYEYDEEGALVRIKKETDRGVKTIQESFNNKAKKVE